MLGPPFHRVTVPVVARGDTEAPVERDESLVRARLAKDHAQPIERDVIDQERGILQREQTLEGEQVVGGARVHGAPRAGATSRCAGSPGSSGSLGSARLLRVVLRLPPGRPGNKPARASGRLLAKTEARPWTSGTGYHEPSNDEPPVTVAHRLDATLGCRKRLGRRPRLFGNAQKCCARLGRRAAPQLPRFGILEPMRAKPRQAWEARALPAELSPRGTDTRALRSTILAVKPAKP